MKVYVVTSGEYSDYGIEEVFTDRGTAEMYANLHSDRRVEEYEADRVKIGTVDRMPYYRVTYNYEKHSIEYYYPEEKYSEPDIGIGYCEIHLCVPSNMRIYQDVSLHGNKSELMLKSASDAFAAYLSEHNTTRETLIEEQRQEREKFRQQCETYNRYKMESSIPNPVNVKANKALLEMIRNGEELPDADGLRKLIEQIREKEETP